ncbi:shikimate dehydrogenase family protein [Qipengyuania atrilutea]|uniref:Shikimate dehydrogenase (NADP(+)) n=1 Tax=Qipengyuania atrilutea TaxID=2744473 RepID=A0A850H5Q8_9SPHN|nr:shikimate dehydrogenase [Actirhodobacter atriluteus]NVD44465.1 shikimate dehydrogenase [Actirhodobacter atriluteus]
MSRPYAEVIGDPIAQSKSPAIHNFWLAKLGLEAEYRATHVKPPELADYITDRRKDPDWRGCNVTMPHKLRVREHLDRVETPAAEIGAVNTVYRGAPELLGTNTDGAGFLEPLLPLLRQAHLFRMARIIGAGGAARAIVHALAAENFTLVLAARDPAKAQALLDELAPEGEHHTPPLEHFAEATGFAFDDREGCCDLIVNASPLGMRGHPALPFDLSHTPPGSIFYDIVTDPVDTEFLKAARGAGFRTIDGLSMLIGQAAAAFGLFFGQPAPREHDGELRDMLTR